MDLVAHLAKFEQDMGRSARIAGDAASRMERSFAGLRNVALGIGSSLAGAFAGVSVGSFVRANIDALDALNDVSDATGATVENLSALEDVARRNGGTLDDVSGVLVKFNGVLKEADGNNGVSQALQAIGLNAKELRALDPAEALRRTAVALAGFADDGNKARLVQELFGKSIKDAAPFLRDLAEQGQLNATVTKQQAEEAEKFNKQMAALQTNVSNAARSLVSELVPALTAFFGQLNANRQAGGFFASIGKEIDANVVSDRLRVVVAEIERLDAYAQKNPGSKAIQIRMEQLRAEAAELSRQALQASAALKGFSEAAKPLQVPFEANFPAAATPSVGALGGSGTKPGARTAAVAARESEFDRYVKRLEQARVALLDLNETERVQLALTTGEIGKLTSAQETQLLSLAGKLDALKSKTALDTPQQSFRRSEIAGTDATNAALAADTLARYNTERERFNALIAATPSAQLEEQRKDMLALADAYEQGRISLEQYTEAVQTRLGTLPKDVTPALDELDERTRQFGRNVQDALGDTIARTMKGEFDSIGDLWKNLLIDMSAQATAASIGDALFGDYFKSGKLGGLLGGVIGPQQGAQAGPQAAAGGINWSAAGSAVAGFFGGTAGAPPQATVAENEQMIKLFAEAGDAAAGNAAALRTMTAASEQTTSGFSQLATSGIATAIQALFGFSAATTAASASAGASTASNAGGWFAKIAAWWSGSGGGSAGAGMQEGGYTGHAGVAQVAGVVHGQEYVFSAPAVRMIGVPALEQLHRSARGGAPRLALAGYADGGYVRPVFVGGREPERMRGQGASSKSLNVTVIQNYAPGTDTRTMSQGAALAAQALQRGARNL